ncbi:MAG: TlpA disulfide reductase family protein [Granulosicoccaceae bacterium]|jgi:thiol-disulfide isomerase/thioredoxin
MKYLAIILALLLPGPAMSQAGGLPPGIIAVNDKPAPAFTLSDMDGNVSVFTTASGQWRFVHFWASWCGPCRKEMPAIEKLVASMQGKAIQFYIINTAEDEDTIFTFLAATAPELHTLMDRDGQVTEAWQPRGLPATYLVDPQGRLRYQALGGREWHQPEYRQFLLRLLTDQ